jgi:hypothetical protein
MLNPLRTEFLGGTAAADLLNDRVIPIYDEHQMQLCRVLTDRGTEYCGAPEHNEYELYLAAENIDHTRTKVKSQQTNGIVERFQRTVLTSSTGWRFAARSTPASNSYRPTLLAGCESTVNYGRIRAAGVMARLHYKPGLTRCRWPEKRCFFRRPSGLGSLGNYSVRITAISTAYDLTINSNRTKWTTIDCQRKS